MGDDDAFDADFLRCLDHRQDLRRSDVAGREHHVVLGDDLEALTRGLGHLTVLGHVQKRPGDAQRAHLAGDAHPVGQLALVLLPGDVLQFVGIVDRRQPDHFGAEAAGDIQRQRIETTD